MPPPSAPDLVRQLAQLGLLEPAQQQELAAAPLPDAPALARDLVRRGGLTPLQANQPFRRLVAMAYLGRAHFLAVAARAMRRALVNHALADKAQKRGGGKTVLSLDPTLALRPASDVDTLELSDAIDRLAALEAENAGLRGQLAGDAAAE